MLINGHTEVIAHIGFPTHAFKAPMIYNPYFEAEGINVMQATPTTWHMLADAGGMQLVVDQVRDRALTATAEAGEPDDAAAMSVQRFALRA